MTPIGTKEILQIGADTARQNDLGTLTVCSQAYTQMAFPL